MGKRTSIYLSDTDIKKLKELKEMLNIYTYSQLIKLCIHNTYNHYKKMLKEDSSE